MTRVYASLPIAEIQQAAGDPAFVRAVESVFAKLDAEIAARRPVCTNRGACCRFADFGHHLFVTAVEVAYFMARSVGTLLAPVDRSYCPYQQDGGCSARAARPGGCRIFFCDPDAQHWQPEQTEQLLRELAAIGERFGVPYAYVEWTDALRLVGGRVAPAQPPVVEMRIDTHERPS